jgi:TrmH family RNA methyltransferase
MITSSANERIKQIRKLQERKERLESGLFYLEGLRIVGEALDSGAAVETLVVAPELLKSEFGQKLVEDQAQRGAAVLEVSADVFRRLALKDGPQGIAAVVRQNWLPLSQAKPVPGRPWIALDAVADPGNLGTILRSSDAAGGEGVILLDQSTDPYDPSAVRASMGALFDQKIVRASFEEFAAWQKSGDWALVGTSDKAEQDYHAYCYPPALVILMGSERQGLLPQHIALCDQLVSIPMLGKSDSLNLAVATAVVLYEVLNQRRQEENP